MTLAQKKARANFKKAIAYRKKTGCSLKQAFAHVKKGGKVGATKVVEKGEKKNAKVTKVLQRVRKANGTFKGYKRVAGSSHKDTKSHNVNIRVVSGVENWRKFTRINNDVNGNPRYVVHFLELLNDIEKTTLPFNVIYEYAVKKANKIGGKKFNNKQYGGGIVFQSYNLDHTWDAIQRIKNEQIKFKY